MTDGGATVKKILPPIAGDVRCNVRSLSQEDPLEEGMATHSSILAWRRGAWMAAVHGITKTQTLLKPLSTNTQMADSLCCTAETNTTL